MILRQIHHFFFHPSGNTQQTLINAYQDLVNAGCTIICDDISFFGSPSFEDGDISQTIKLLSADGNHIFISSAGNYQQSHYQGSFFPINNSSILHDFSHVGNYSIDPSPNAPYLYADLNSNSTIDVTLQWDDPWGQSDNDYDLELTDQLDNILATSNGIQNGNKNHMKE